MNREIKFRGKCLTNGEWLYGYYFVNSGEHFIVKDELAPNGNTFLDYKVDSKTVGQFTGLYLDGNEIYEHDLIENCGCVYEVVYNEHVCSFCLLEELEHEIGSTPLGYMLDTFKFKHIGNIHDNPELLNKHTIKNEK